MKSLRLREAAWVAMIILGLIFATGSLFADTEEPVNTAIDSSTWTEIAMDGSTPCSSYLFQSRDGSDFKWKKTAGSTDYFTVKDGAALTINFNRERKPTTLFYAQSASGTPVIEVFIYNNN